MLQRSRRSRGMVLSIILMVLSILLVLGFLFASVGTVNLGFASQDANKERAYQAAEAGLANATALLVTTGTAPATPNPNGTLWQSVGSLPGAATTFNLTGSAQHDYATVTYYDNHAYSTAGLVAPVNLSIPGGTIYVVSQGFACSNGSPLTSAQVGALFSVNTGTTVAYAVQAGHITVNATTSSPGTFIDGWNSAQSSTPTNNARAGSPLLATNSTQTGAVNVTSTSVQGQVMVPHGAPQNVVTGTGVQLGYLTGPMNFGLSNPDTVVPSAPDSYNLVPSPGTYGTVTISSPTTLAAGTYQMNSLVINSGGSLTTTTGGGTVTLTVEDSMTLPTSSVAFYNPANPSNCFNITYLGSTGVNVTLGATSTVVVNAPHANLAINTDANTLGGAWFAQNIQLNLLNPGSTTIFCDLNYGTPTANPNNGGLSGLGGQTSIITQTGNQGNQTPQNLPQVLFLSKQRY